MSILIKIGRNARLLALGLSLSMAFAPVAFAEPPDMIKGMQKACGSVKVESVYEYDRTELARAAQEDSFQPDTEGRPRLILLSEMDDYKTNIHL